MLDNFPFTREQFTLLIERALIPDTVICLKDDSEHGSFLAKRWTQLRQAEKHLPDIQEVDDKTEESGDVEKDGKSLDKHLLSLISYVILTSFQSKTSALLVLLQE